MLCVFVCLAYCVITRKHHFFHVVLTLHRPMIKTWRDVYRDRSIILRDTDMYFVLFYFFIFFLGVKYNTWQYMSTHAKMKLCTYIRVLCTYNLYFVLIYAYAHAREVDLASRVF